MVDVSELTPGDKVLVVQQGLHYLEVGSEAEVVRAGTLNELADFDPLLANLVAATSEEVRAKPHLIVRGTGIGNVQNTTQLLAPEDVRL